MTSGNTINPRELCSRKLWEMVNNRDQQLDNKIQLEAVIAELEVRRSYLTELESLGMLHKDS